MRKQNRRTLNQLSEGERGVVTAVQEAGTMKKRLLDLGLTAGTTVVCLHRSPSGSPTAFSIRGAVIALRREDAEKVLLSPLSRSGKAGVSWS